MVSQHTSVEGAAHIKNTTPRATGRPKHARTDSDKVAFDATKPQTQRVTRTLAGSSKRLRQPGCLQTPGVLGKTQPPAPRLALHPRGLPQRSPRHNPRMTPRRTWWHGQIKHRGMDTGGRRGYNAWAEDSSCHPHNFEHHVFCTPSSCSASHHRHGPCWVRPWHVS
jgi:hypothetical protein